MHNQVMLRYQNGYIAIIFLCTTDNSSLQFDCNLFMLDIKVLTNGVQFLRNNHMKNVEIIHFKYYLLKCSIGLYITLFPIEYSKGIFSLQAFWHFSLQLHNLLLPLSVITAEDSSWHAIYYHPGESCRGHYDNEVTCRHISFGFLYLWKT